MAGTHCQGMNSPPLAWSIVLWIACSFFVGCNRKDAELERRVQKLEEKVSGTLDAQLHLIDMLRDRDSNSMWGLTNLVLKMSEAHRADADFQDGVVKFMDDFERRVRVFAADELERQLQARAAQFKAGARPVAPAPGRPAEAVRDGVPLAVWNQIANEAAAKWPGNFEMQEYTIRNQIEAWRKIQR